MGHAIFLPQQKKPSCSFAWCWVITVLFPVFLEAGLVNGHLPVSDRETLLQLLKKSVEENLISPAQAGKFLLLLAVTQYHDSPADTEEDMQTLTGPLSFTMQSVIASSFGAESLQQAVSLPEAPALEPGEIITCEALVNQLNLEMGKKLNQGFEFTADQALLQNYLQGAGLLTAVPESTTAASRQVMKWINKEYVIWIFTFDKNNAKAMEIMKLNSGKIEVRVEAQAGTQIGSKVTVLSQNQLANILKIYYKPKKDVLATYLP